MLRNVVCPSWCLPSMAALPNNSHKEGAELSEVIIVAILSLAGTLMGSLAGILTANKLTNYRIEQLEKKVEKHNNVLERVYELEKNEALIKEEIEHLGEFHK